MSNINAIASSTMFTKLKQSRSNWERIWEMSAQYTLPELYLEDGTRDSGYEPEDLMIGDSVGAEILSNFVSQLSKVAFPKQGSFFRLSAKEDSEKLKELSEADRQELFRKMEESAMKQLVRRRISSVTEPILGGMVGLGDVVCKIPRGKNEHIQVYDLNDCVIKRANNGKLIHLIICEKTEVTFLSKQAKTALHNAGKRYRDTDEVKLYTHVKLNGDEKYTISHSVDDVPLPTKDNFYTQDNLEYKVFSIGVKRGSNYGFGVVQKYLPLIHKANVYADANADTAVAGSTVNWAIDPSANIRPEEFANREQGEPFPIKPDQIKAIVADVGQHLQITAGQYSQIVATLHRVFLMFTAVQRDAERVTAEEIRTILTKLEESHSGLYNTIAENLQRPLATMAVSLITDPELVEFKDEVEVLMVTTLETMSRSAEQESLLTALSELTIFNSVPPQVQESLKISDISNRIFTNRGHNPDEFVKTEEEVQAEKQAIAQAEAGAQAQAQPQLNQTQVFQANDALLENINDPLL